MNLRLTIPTAFLTTLMVLAAFACCVGVAAEATPPSWEEGDAWAMGFERDLGAEFADQISSIEQMIQENVPDVDLENFDADGSVEFYLVFEVADETDSQYLLTGDMGQKLYFSLDVQLTAMLPDEGTYDPFEDEPSMSEKTISLGASIDYALWAHAEAVLKKPSTAIESLSLELHGSASLEATVENFPNIASSDGEMTVSYENIDISITMVVDIEIDIDFEPALDIFQFPFDVGDEWTVESNATISGTLGGYLDMQGIPEEYTADLFNEPMMVENGITDFPIQLDQLTFDEEDGPQISNGVMEPTTVPIEFNISCVGSNLVTLPTWGQVTVYILEMEDGERFRYSPDVKFMTNMDVDFQELFNESGVELPFEMPEDMELLNEDDMTMGSVDPGVAQSNIQEIVDYESGVPQESDGSDFADFFFKEPYLGLILLVLVMVIVIAVVFVVVRRR